MFHLFHLLKEIGWSRIKIQQGDIFSRGPDQMSQTANDMFRVFFSSSSIGSPCKPMKSGHVLQETTALLY